MANLLTQSAAMLDTFPRRRARHIAPASSGGSPKVRCSPSPRVGTDGTGLDGFTTIYMFVPELNWIERWPPKPKVVGSIPIRNSAKQGVFEQGRSREKDRGYLGATTQRSVPVCFRLNH